MQANIGTWSMSSCVSSGSDYPLMEVVWLCKKNRVEASRRLASKKYTGRKEIRGLVPLVPARIKKMAAATAELRRQNSLARGPELGRGVRETVENGQEIIR